MEEAVPLAREGVGGADDGQEPPAAKQTRRASHPWQGEIAFQVESGEKAVGIRLQSHGIFFS